MLDLHGLGPENGRGRTTKDQRAALDFKGDGAGRRWILKTVEVLTADGRWRTEGEDDWGRERKRRKTSSNACARS